MADQSMSSSRSIGTPGEYTNNLYRVYFEVGEHDGFAGQVIANFLAVRLVEITGTAFVPESLRRQAHGYEADIPLQLVPEVVRELSAKNVAVYQVIRINKL